LRGPQGGGVDVELLELDADELDEDDAELDDELDADDELDELDDEDEADCVVCGDGLGLAGLGLDGGASAPMRGRSEGPRVNGAWLVVGPVTTRAAITAPTATAAPPTASPTAAGRRAGRSPVFCGDSR
jgi:hypothetical protein